MTIPNTGHDETTRTEPDRATARAAIALAVRAPSVHNSQPWRWWIGDRVVQLHADLTRWLQVTDTDGRDLLLSCGAALHHLRVALAALGVDHDVERLPDPDQPDLLARVRLRPGSGHHLPGVDPAHSRAIAGRRTDRRPFLDWPLPDGFLTRLTDDAAENGVHLRAVTDPAGRDLVHEAARTAAADHAGTPGYDSELALWTGRYGGSDGVPAANVPAPRDADEDGLARRFARAELVSRDGPLRDGATLLVLGTASDDNLSRLRAGEGLSAVLLRANALGLAGCPLSEPLEVEGTRSALRDRVLGATLCPQVLVRVGWSSPDDGPAASPRRSLDDQIDTVQPHW